MSTITDEDILQALKKTQADFHFPGGRLELITKERQQDVFDAMKEVFLNDEPLEKSLGMEWSSDIEMLWISALDQKMSLMVVNEENGDIMGLRVVRVSKKDDHFDINEFKDENVRKLVGFFLYTEKFDFFSHYDITEVFEFFGLGVVPKYRRKGLGTLLMEAGVKFVRNLGIKNSHIKGSASSNFSKKIFDKCGFETLNEIQFAEYEIDGKPVFNNTGEHKSLKTYGKRL